MDKVKKYSRWIKIFHALAFGVFLFCGLLNLVTHKPYGITSQCIGDVEITDYKCWVETRTEGLKITEAAGIKSTFIWFPLFAVSMFGLWQFIRLMGSFQLGVIFSLENFRRMRWIGYTYIGLFFGETFYISLTQAITKLLMPGLPGESHLTLATGTTSLLPGLLFLIMAHAVEAALQMKQELEEVV
ncbi:MAG TPA: DUF2975 domain-containing protein [Oligoflexus sp.]|uniref:DUF2975 domain-containing protein n=1 Tax=Oligoflexus sp. TaxID=1971216 RepID=UPI002D3E6452|nr:DUF2975 domain-containing protein [Oligoflexus sp.]HYX33416.1 DUF2975 domain-containing protein [Oligoflexus sp.]